MKPIIKEFIEREISPVSTLRTILLFGRNVSTYKFALADTLLKANSILSLPFNRQFNFVNGTVLTLYLKS